MPQSEVTAIATREAEQARRQAVREVTERLGCTVEEAEQILMDRRTQEESALSEVEKRERAATAREQKAAEAEATANSALRTAYVRDVLLDSGARRDRVNFILPSIVGNLPDDAGEAEVAVAVDSLKTDVPEMFDEGAPPKPKPPPSDPGRGPKPPAKPEEDGFARGADRAKEHRF